MKRRIYYEKHETKTTNIKGYIEIEIEYIQLYKNFASIVTKIDSPTSFKLLHWMLAEKMNQDNGIQASRLFIDFNTYLEEQCGKECTIQESTFYRSMKELVAAGALTRISQGLYLANPNLFWGKEVEARIEHLKEHDLSDGEIKLLNP